MGTPKPEAKGLRACKADSRQRKPSEVLSLQADAHGDDMGMCALPVQTKFHAKVGILTSRFSNVYDYKIRVEGFLKY